MSGPNDPVVPSRGLLAGLVDNARRWSNAPDQPPPGRRRVAGDLGDGLRLGVLDDDLAYEGTATASIWVYDPVAEQMVDSGLDIEVRDWLLEEDFTLPAESRVVIASIGASAFVVQSGACPTED